LIEVSHGAEWAEVSGWGLHNGITLTPIVLVWRRV